MTDWAYPSDGGPPVRDRVSLAREARKLGPTWWSYWLWVTACFPIGALIVARPAIGVLRTLLLTGPPPHVDRLLRWTITAERAVIGLSLVAVPAYFFDQGGVGWASVAWRSPVVPAASVWLLAMLAVRDLTPRGPIRRRWQRAVAAAICADGLLVGTLLLSPASPTAGAALFSSAVLVQLGSLTFAHRAWSPTRRWIIEHGLAELARRRDAGEIGHAATSAVAE